MFRKKKAEEAKTEKTKVYLIKRTFVTEGLVETEVDCYETEEKCNEAWNSLVLSHNNMMIDCHEIDLNHIDENEWYYDWNDKELTCYDKREPEAEAYYFEKDWEYIN